MNTSNWLIAWPADGSDKDSGAAVSANTRYLLTWGLVPGGPDQAHWSIKDIDADSREAHSVRQGFMSNTATFEPFIEVETKTSAARSVRVYKFEYAQAM